MPLIVGGCFFVFLFFFFYDGEVVMEDGLGEFFFFVSSRFFVRLKMNRIKNTWKKEKKNGRILYLIFNEREVEECEKNLFFTRVFCEVYKYIADII